MYPLSRVFARCGSDRRCQHFGATRCLRLRAQVSWWIFTGRIVQDRTTVKGVFFSLSLSFNQQSEYKVFYKLMCWLVGSPTSRLTKVMRSPLARRSRWSVTTDWCLVPRRWGFYNTHNDSPQSVGLLWTSGQLVAQTSTWQHTTITTDIHAPCGIRAHDLSRRAAVDLRLRPRDHCDRHGKSCVAFVT